MAKLGFLRLASLGALLLAFAMQVALAEERFTREVTFDIAAQSVEAALIEFSKQADVQVMVGGALTGQKTEGVKGKLSVTDGLDQLLKNTGLEYQAKGNTITVRSMKNARADVVILPLRDEARLVSSDARGEVARQGDSSSAQNSPTLKPEVLAEVVVTGTNIKGVAAAGSNIISLDRVDIEKTGVATVQEVMKLLPQNFGGGANENTRVQFGNVSDPAAQSNVADSSSINLRGLGSSATLVLINGRRFSPGGTGGLFVDVSSIPLSAVERIDVLADGASAIYGSDAIGGVVNFILRKDYEGAETGARFGSVTSGGSSEYQISQVLGTSWGNGHGLLSFEHYKREALAGSERRQAANSDLRSLGGDNFDVIFSNPGNILAGADSWAIPRGQDGSSLEPSDFALGTTNLFNSRQGADVYGEQTKDSLLATISHSINDRVELFADALATRREFETRGPGLRRGFVVTPDNPYYVNPTGGSDPIVVLYNFYDDLGGVSSTGTVKTVNVTLGGSIALGADWSARAYAQYGREETETLSDDVSSTALDAALMDPDPTTAFNPFGDGSFTNPQTLVQIRSGFAFESTSNVKAANLTVDGPVWTSRSGTARLAVGVDRREQTFNSIFSPPDPPVLDNDYDRSITAGFAELHVPLVGEQTAFGGAKALELSLAVRYEDYSDFGNTTNPKVGLRWVPLNGITLRGTWGTSFKAPELSDLDETFNNFSFVQPAPDSSAPGGVSSVLTVQGGNADLSEERAESWTAGIDFAPSSASGVSVGLTYFNIHYKDRIQDAANSINWLNEPQFADIVFRNPTPEQRAFFCSKGTYLDFGVGDCLTADIAAIVDIRKNNTAIVNTDGFDILASYPFATQFGDFDAELNATYLLTFEQAQRSASPLIELIDTATNPLRFRARGSVSWSRNQLGSTVSVNYMDSYVDSVSTMSRPIDSWTTVDVQLTYRWPVESRLLNGTLLSLSISNVFDKEPPFFNNPIGIGFDPTKGDLRGRFAALMVQKKW